MSDGAALRLAARDDADLAVIAAALQDAIVPLSEMRYSAAERRFLLVASRFRWEQAPETAEAAGAADAAFRDPLSGDRRVLSALVVDDVTAARSRGIDRREPGQFLSLLTLRRDGGAAIELLFSGGGALRLDVGSLAVFLADLGESWPVPRRPRHDGDPGQDAA